MKETDAFGKDVGITKVKAYMVFILTFTAVTNSVVCHNILPCNNGATDCTFAEICGVDAIPACQVDYWIILRTPIDKPICWFLKNVSL